MNSRLEHLRFFFVGALAVAGSSFPMSPFAVSLFSDSLFSVSPVFAQQSPPMIVSELEQAHGEASWDSKEVAEVGIDLFFGGKQRLNGKMIFNVEASKSRLELADGTVMVFDGESAWIAPREAPYKKPRFDLLTWPYFFAAMYKFDDDGVHVVSTGEKELLGSTYDTAKVSFDQGVGDSPDDWYLIYVDKEAKTLKAMSYIVTYGKGKEGIEEAEKHPHAIVYDSFQTVSGVTFASDWKFYNWSEEKGVYGDPLGSARLKDLIFRKPDPKAFKAPSGAKKDPLPQ